MTGIKCNNIDCKFVDPTAKLEDYVNKPCPECGEVFFSEQDLIVLQNMEGMMNTMRQIPGFKQIEESLMSSMGSSIDFNSFGDMFSNEVETKPVDTPVEKVSKKTRRSKKHKHE